MDEEKYSFLEDYEPEEEHVPQIKEIPRWLQELTLMYYLQGDSIFIVDEIIKGRVDMWYFEEMYDDWYYAIDEVMISRKIHRVISRAGRKEYLEKENAGMKIVKATDLVNDIIEGKSEMIMPMKR